MDHSPADVVRWLIVALGAGTNPTSGAAWPVYCADEPDLPDNCITIYDRSAPGQGRRMFDGATVGPAGVQVRVRSTTHAVGWVKIQTIHDLLAARDSVYRRFVLVGTTGYTVHALVNIDDPLALGKDVTNTKRRLFTMNASAHVGPALGPVAYYPLDGTLADSSGYGRDLVNAGADATFGTPGAVGTHHLTSGGTGTAVSGLSIPAASWTFAYRVQFTGTSVAVTVAHALTTDAGSFTFSNTQSSRAVTVSAPNANTVSWSGQTGQWYAVAAVKEGTTLTLYVDGVAVGQAAVDATVTITGLTVRASSRHLMDEIGIWDRALSATEVAAL